MLVVERQQVVEEGLTYFRVGGGSNRGRKAGGGEGMEEPGRCEGAATAGRLVAVSDEAGEIGANAAEGQQQEGW